MEDEKRRIDKVDRISSLPESLLQHIMSYLPFKQVVQTSLVSNEWRQAWLTFPVLEFDEFNLPDEFNSPRVEKVMQIRPYWKQILQIRHTNMVGVREMTLKTFSRTGDSELADRCVFYAIENNVKELVLQIEQIQFAWLNNQTQWYNLPPVVLCSKSIEVLKLEGCKLELPRSDLKLSLRKLYLYNVYADDQVINNVLLGCGLLEELEVAQCQGFKSLKLLGLAKLRDIRLQNRGVLKQLEIDTLNGNSALSICGVMPYKFDVCAALNLSEAHLGFYSYKIRHIFMDSQNIEPEWYVKYVELLAKFRQCSQVLNLNSQCWEHVHFPGELRQVLTPPLSGVKHINFTADLLKLNKYALARVVDFLLWISPHAETICLEYHDDKEFRFQFSYKQPPVYEGEIARCCKFVPVVLCWEHCIEKVDIEITSTYIEKYNAARQIRRSKEVKRCVFEGENILEKIDGLAVSKLSNITEYE
ncbi:F-box family protein [Melia azedarach]|uniref:F-box family protein n=1 Tax=Melia azedarach TaxID=155640 RepID=A0ACC1Y4N3_MELAZ|nr:F-box family protein [Melia azedarach]